MKNITITSESADTVRTLHTNTANVMTPIMDILVQEGQRLMLSNRTVANGAVFNGASIVMELKDAAGNVIRDGTLQVSTRTPLSDADQPMRGGLPLSIWAPYSTKEQKNAQYKGTLAQKTDLNVGPGVLLVNRTKLILSISSSKVVDWTKSYVEIDFSEVNG